MDKGRSGQGHRPRKDRRKPLNARRNKAYTITISALTFAEVHKKKGHEKLTDTENGHLLKYFENEFIVFVEVDRFIAEEANRMCRRFADNKLSPADAIHLASAVRAGCDCLLTWDGGLLSIPHPTMKIEHPRITKQGPLFEPK